MQNLEEQDKTDKFNCAKQIFKKAVKHEKRIFRTCNAKRGKIHNL